jgi:hypothetical protein
LLDLWVVCDLIGPSRSELSYLKSLVTEAKKAATEQQSVQTVPLNFGKATQQQRGLKINFREIFRVVRFSTFATKSMAKQTSRRKAATSVFDPQLGRR